MGCMNSNAETDGGKATAAGGKKKGSGAAGQRKPDYKEPLSPGPGAGIVKPQPSTSLVFNMASPSVTGFTGEYNDTVIKPSQSVFSNRGVSMRSEGLLDTPSQRRPTLTYTSSLCEKNPKFRMGKELLIMTWNIHHDSDCTPFDFYCDFRNLSLKERDAVSIEILWDVARVFFYPDAPSGVCSETLLKDLVPKFLLDEKQLKQYVEKAGMDEDEKKEVMNYPDTTLHTFLMAHALQDDTKMKRNQNCSFIKTHLKNDKRKSSPLRPAYSAGAVKDLLVSDPTMLPVLILDSLHTLVIQFSHFLIDNQLRKAFSEFEPQEQIERVKEFLEKRDSENLVLPQPFKSTRERLYGRWKAVFQSSNKIKQVASKVSVSGADIVLLQRVSQEAYQEVKKEAAFGNPNEWAVVPDKFPANVKETTCMCLRKATIEPDVSKKKVVETQNFYVPCKSEEGINFLCGVASLTPGAGCGAIRTKEAQRLARFVSKKNKNSVVLGGLFNEDLTALENQVSMTLLRKFNGIDHTQEEPLAFSVNRTRTNLQFEIRKADKQDKGVQDGIFATFPLVGEAYTDFQHSGLENPSDHGPVFQRVLVQT